MLFELEKNEENNVSGGEGIPCTVWAVAPGKCNTFPSVSGSAYYVWINCCNSSTASMQCNNGGAYPLQVSELENCLSGENVTICGISGNPAGHYCIDGSSASRTNKKMQ